MDKDYVQELIDDLIKFQKENRVKGYGIERQIERTEGGNDYGEELYIKFTIKG